MSRSERTEPAQSSMTVLACLPIRHGVVVYQVLLTYLLIGQLIGLCVSRLLLQNHVPHVFKRARCILVIHLLLLARTRTVSSEHQLVRGLSGREREAMDA